MLGFLSILIWSLTVLGQFVLVPTKPTPGARSAKENINKGLIHPLPFAGHRGLGKASFKTETTLGNGYLGSRIDEERSEMRYLV